MEVVRMKGMSGARRMSCLETNAKSNVIESRTHTCCNNLSLLVRVKV